MMAGYPLMPPISDPATYDAMMAAAVAGAGAGLFPGLGMEQEEDWASKKAASNSNRRRGGQEDSANRPAILPAERKAVPEQDPDAPKTTVMLRNMPNNQTRKMLLELLDREGFQAEFDFVYLPMDFKTRASLGYAFVNFTSAETANRAFSTFDGFTRWPIPSRKVCGVGWSGPHQGFEAHVDRYRNSPVMHEEVPDTFKPIILSMGVRVPFPPPSKKLRAPRIRGDA
jgi:hypothetical protein